MRSAIPSRQGVVAQARVRPPRRSTSHDSEAPALPGRIRRSLARLSPSQRLFRERSRGSFRLFASPPDHRTRRDTRSKESAHVDDCLLPHSVFQFAHLWFNVPRAWMALGVVLKFSRHTIIPRLADVPVIPLPSERGS